MIFPKHFRNKTFYQLQTSIVFVPLKCLFLRLKHQTTIKLHESDNTLSKLSVVAQPMLFQEAIMQRMLGFFIFSVYTEDQ